MSVAGDEDYEWPVIWMHEDTSSLSTGGVKCCGATPVGALDTAALHLPLHPSPAVGALLPVTETREGGGIKVTSNKRKEGKERKGNTPGLKE